MDYSKEAEACRRKALRYLGKPEAPFLLQVARAFDDLDRSSASDDALDTRRAAVAALPQTVEAQ
jgi:hypothetical protein